MNLISTTTKSVFLTYSLSLTEQTFQCNEQKLDTEKPHAHPTTPKLPHTLPFLSNTNTEESYIRPVLQIWHGEVPADEAHLQADDLSVFGGRGAAVFR